MHVRSDCPLRVASLVWQPRPGAFALTVVCKATYALVPGTAPLASLQDEPHARDVPWGDDPRESLRYASDLVPFKRRADVLLVGHAYAPGGQPVTSLRARLYAGTVDKTIALHGDRFFAADGSLGEPSRFTRMPLRWERAAGGRGTKNPVGLSLDAPPDRLGRVSVPNLLPPEARLQSRRDVLDPVGFGPVAPAWAERVAHLHRHAASWDHARWFDRPLPDDVDAGYFNAAPPDQQMAEMAAEVRIVLENLHPEHAQLVTTLQRVVPSAVLRAGASPQPVRLRCDTLCIDTDRALVSLTWRGTAPLDAPAQAGEIVVTLEDKALVRAPPAALAATASIDPAIIKAAVALPFGAAPASPSPSAAPPPRAPALPGLAAVYARFGSTGSLDPEIVRAAAAAALPFAPAEAPREAPPPLDAYPLERCAAIAASIARRKADKGAILERHELTSEAWSALDAHWTEAVQKELGRGKAGLLSAYDAAYLGQLESERGEITVEEYAALVVAAERGTEKETLAKLDMPRGAVLRVQRVWMKKMGASPALGKLVRAAVGEAGEG